MAILAVAMAGLAGARANAAPVGTKFARLVQNGSTITVNDDYILVSKWFALGAVIWAVVFPVLAVYFAIRLYKHYNLGLHLVSNIGLAAIGLPPSVTLVAEEFGFLKVDGGLSAPSAWIACTSMVCMMLMNSIKHLFAPHSLGPQTTKVIEPSASGGGEAGPQIPHEPLSQIFVETLVEGGIPPASDVVKYLIGKVEKIEGEDVYDGLPERLRFHVFNNIVNEHDVDDIVLTICKAAPEGIPLRKPAAKRLVNLCRNSARNTIQAFIGRVDFFRAELVNYRDRAKPNEQTRA